MPGCADPPSEPWLADEERRDSGVRSSNSSVARLTPRPPAPGSATSWAARCPRGRRAAPRTHGPRPPPARRRRPRRAAAPRACPRRTGRWPAPPGRLDRHAVDAAAFPVPVAGTGGARHRDPRGALVVGLVPRDVGAQHVARQVPGRGLGERLLDLGLQAQRLAQRLVGQPGHLADRVLDGRREGLGARGVPGPRASASSPMSFRPTSAIAGASCPGGLGADVAPDQAGR